MNTNINIARMVGALFIVGTVAGILSVVCTYPILGGPDLLVKVAANANRVALGELFVLIMGLALAMVPVVIFPVLKKHNEILALGYIVFRGALETGTYLVTVISWLLLVIIGQKYVTAGAAAAPYFQALGDLALKAAGIGATTTSIVFSLGALMLYVVLYQAKLLPRWLSVWGLIGAILYLASGLFALFSVELGILMALLAVQEMVMAVWLIVKGFEPAALAAGAAKAEMG
jgi:hypothetical protein